MSALIPRCRIVPEPEDRVRFVVDGRERLTWHFGRNAPRPFFYPVIGPSGAVLTRMGHPGAPNHDHHRSLWFAHHKVLGIDFWSDQTTARIRQSQWLAYEDGDNEAIMACRLEWFDGHDPKPLLSQELCAAVRPWEAGELLIELQATFRPTAASLEFGQTNFGFLAVRVARSISAHFGGGRLTGSSGNVGEKALFEKPARWMDYSGPVPAPNSEAVEEGITYIDHPGNPGQPTRWHVRDDGWMGAAPCMGGPLLTTQEKPLRVRYLLHVHSGPVDADRADHLAEQFSRSAAIVVRRSGEPHRQFEAVRAES